MRPLWDYYKVKKLVGFLVRNQRVFFKRKNHLQYLDVGCDENTHPEFVNLDFRWNRHIDVCMDITKGKYPFSGNRFKGIFSEHCLEHISFEQFRANLQEFYRILKPGGTVRIVMPDGELYLDIYQRRKNGEKISMPYEEGFITPMHRINGIFRDHGHQFIYDFETVKLLLEQVGFTNVRKESFGKGRDKNLLIDSEHRALESMYIEAGKP